MKIRFKFNREMIIPSILLSIMVIAIFPYIALLHPSVQESINPSRGECNLYYKGEYIKCISYEEAVRINRNLLIIVSLIFSSVLIFTNLLGEEKTKLQELKNGK